MSDVISNGNGAIAQRTAELIDLAQRRERAEAKQAKAKDPDPSEHFVDGEIRYPWGARRGGRMSPERHLPPGEPSEDDGRFLLARKAWPKGETHDRVPDWLAPRREISANAKVVYARMRRLSGGDGPVASPSMKRLEIDLGLSYKQVRRALTELRSHNLIKAVGKTDHGTTSYRMVDHPWRRFFMGNGYDPERYQEKMEKLMLMTRLPAHLTTPRAE